MSADLLTLAEIEAGFPATWSKLVALSPFQGPHLACRHVVDGQDGVVCAQHPGAGLACTACIDHHVERHDPAAEMTCDECGAGVDAIHGLAIECAGPLALFDTLGRAVRRWRPVHIIGLGICAPCGAAKRAA